MSLSANKIKVSVRLEPDVHKAAEHYAARMNIPLAIVVADAAKQTLLPQYRKDAELASVRAIERCFNKLRVLEDRIGTDLHVLKEMIGLAVRVYLNHTAAVPEEAKSAATLSGRIRFERYLDLLARNLRTGASILSEPPPQEVLPQPAPETPRQIESLPEPQPVQGNLFQHWEKDHAAQSNGGPPPAP